MELKEQWEKSFPKILTLSVLKQLKTCQTENLHEIMQTSIGNAFRCLYFHSWLVLNP